MPQTQSLGEFIREKRKGLGLTQEELCAKVGIEQGYLTQIERNKRMGSPETLLAVARALGIKPAYKIFAVLDPGADLDEEGISGVYIRLPDGLSQEDQRLAEQFLMRLSQLRRYERVPYLSEKKDQKLDQEITDELRRHVGDHNPAEQDASLLERVEREMQAEAKPRKKVGRRRRMVS
jgi:transcriptional regulator with XRE-family HTH domain